MHGFVVIKGIEVERVEIYKHVGIVLVTAILLYGFNVSITFYNVYICVLV